MKRAYRILATVEATIRRHGRCLPTLFVRRKLSASPVTCHSHGQMHTPVCVLSCVPHSQGRLQWTMMDLEVFHEKPFKLRVAFCTRLCLFEQCNLSDEV